MSDLIVTRKFKEYRFTTKQIEKEDKEDGFVEVEVTDEMMEDIGINEEFKQEVVNGKKRIIGKLWRGPNTCKYYLTEGSITVDKFLTRNVNKCFNNDPTLLLVF